VDYNWEYPRTQADWNGLFKLLSETKNFLKPKGGLVTMAFYPGQEATLNPKIFDVVDYFHMMSYDSRGRHSTLDFAISSTRDALKYIPKDKLTVGVPFYSRHVESGVPKTYGEMVDMVGGTVNPNTDQIESYYYNGYATIKKKTEFVIKQEIGGIMIWEVGQDIHPSNKFALLNAITEARKELKPARKGTDDEL
jgi:GH18 family chitinase